MLGSGRLSVDIVEYEKLEGHVIVGGTVSTMLILKEQVEVNPELSLAVQVAVVTPRGKL